MRKQHQKPQQEPELELWQQPFVQKFVREATQARNHFELMHNLKEYQKEIRLLFRDLRLNMTSRGYWSKED